VGGKAEDCELELGVAVGRVLGFLVEKLGGGGGCWWLFWSMRWCLLLFVVRVPWLKGDYDQ